MKHLKMSVSPGLTLRAKRKNPFGKHKGHETFTYLSCRCRHGGMGGELCGHSGGLG